MSCSSCHNPHDGNRPKMIGADSVNELCYKCHTEKRGPFLFEHAAVREDCVSCHDPHGSNHKRLLVAEDAEPVLELPPERLGATSGSATTSTPRRGVPVAPTGAPSGYPTAPAALRREELQELPRQPPRLQLAARRLLREVNHEASIDSDSAPRHGYPHGEFVCGSAGQDREHAGGQVTLELLGRSDVSSSKFEEYREVPKGVSLPFLNLFATTSRSTSTCGRATSGRATSATPAGSTPATSTSAFDYNQTPHNMGNNGRTIV